MRLSPRKPGRDSLIRDHLTCPPQGVHSKVKLDFPEDKWRALSTNIHKQAARLILTADRREIKDDFSVLLQGNRLAQDQRDRPTASPG